MTYRRAQSHSLLTPIVTIWHITDMGTRKLTHEQLAARIGKSRSYVSKVLSGKRSPTLPLALRIFDVTGTRLGPLTDKTDAEIETLRQASQILDDRPEPYPGTSDIHLVGETS